MQENIMTVLTPIGYLLTKINIRQIRVRNNCFLLVTKQLSTRIEAVKSRFEMQRFHMLIPLEMQSVIKCKSLKRILII